MLGSVIRRRVVVQLWLSEAAANAAVRSLHPLRAERVEQGLQLVGWMSTPRQRKRCAPASIEAYFARIANTQVSPATLKRVTLSTCGDHASARCGMHSVLISARSNADAVPTTRHIVRTKHTQRLNSLIVRLRWIPEHWRDTAVAFSAQQGRDVIAYMCTARNHGHGQEEHAAPLGLKCKYNSSWAESLKHALQRDIPRGRAVG